jgi:CO/xanthine dehydrogenase Mo-binding subunit
VTVSIGTPDIGGSRASIALMTAETLGIPYENVRVNVVETGALGVNEPTHGSRATFASGKAAVEAARQAMPKCAAAPRPNGALTPRRWNGSMARRIPAGPNAGKFPPMTIGEIGAKMGGTGGPISGHHEVTAGGVGASFGTHVVDVEVDPETGRTTVLRYLVVQDAGRAIHPAYVEGQYQGGAAQGIGWALNEEYVYGADGTAAEHSVPRLPSSGRIRPADDRHCHRRGAEPRPPLRRARCRRNRHHAAPARTRQRHCGGDGRASPQPAHVTAQGAGRAQGARLRQRWSM